MSSFLPPSFNTAIFNSNAFAGGSYITKAQADLLYLNLASGQNLYMLDVVPGITQNSRALVYNSSGFINDLKVQATTGDLITLSASSITGRSSILHTVPNNSLESGIRGSNEGIFPNTFYRYSNGQFRFLQELSTGNATNYGSMSIIRDAGNQLSIASTDNVERANVLMTTLNNTLEIGVRNNTGSHPNSFYRHMNGNYRYVQNINGDATNFGRFTVNTSGSHLSLVNGSNTGFLEVSSSGILRIVDGLSMNLESTGLRIDSLGNTSAARSRLDLGSSISDRTLSIFNNGTAFYGLSANNNALQYQSNVNHLWTSGCTDASPLGTTIMSMNNTGSLTCYDNTIMKKGFFIERQVFSSSGRSGKGISAFYANSDPVAKVFAYDYSASTFNGLQLGNCLLVNGNGGGTVTIDNAVSASGSYPLTVSSWWPTSFGGSYGYLGPSGSGTGVGTGAADVSIYSNKRVWAQEFNAFSDGRLKENIKDLSEDDSIDFVRNVKPVSFTWKADKDKKRSIGYIAQSILKHGKFDELVSLGPDANLEEEIEIIDGNKFVSPEGHRFNVSYQSAVPILHSALASLFDYVEELTTDIEDLKKMLGKKISRGEARG